jgi:hypothetical protein
VEARKGGEEWVEYGGKIWYPYSGKWEWTWMMAFGKSCVVLEEKAEKSGIAEQKQENPKRIPVARDRGRRVSVSGGRRNTMAARG